MLKFELVQTDKHSIKILLRRKNLRFLRRTNHIQNRCKQCQSSQMPKTKKVAKKAITDKNFKYNLCNQGKNTQCG